MVHKYIPRTKPPRIVDTHLRVDGRNKTTLSSFSTQPKTPNEPVKPFDETDPATKHCQRTHTIIQSIIQSIIKSIIQQSTENESDHKQRQATNRFDT